MHYLRFELRRFRKIFILFWCVVIINFVLIDKGVKNYNNFEHKVVGDFQVLEEAVVKGYSDYLQYSTRGFRIFKKPTPLYPIFNLNVRDKTVTTVDTSSDLKFNRSVKSNIQSSGAPLEGIMLLTIIVLGVYCGHTIFIRPDTSFLKTVWARLFIVNILALSITLPKLIFISSPESIYKLCTYNLIIHLTVSIFFILGIALKQSGAKLSYALSITAAVVVILTSLVFAITTAKTNNQRTEEDLSKELMYKMMRFQNQIGQKLQKFSPDQRKEMYSFIVSEMQNNYLKNVLPEIKETEREFYRTKQNINKTCSYIALLSPISYIKVYESYLTQGEWQSFIDYWVRFNI